MPVNMYIHTSFIIRFCFNDSMILGVCNIYSYRLELAATSVCTTWNKVFISEFCVQFVVSK